MIRYRRSWGEELFSCRIIVSPLSFDVRTGSGIILASLLIARLSMMEHSTVLWSTLKLTTAVSSLKRKSGQRPQQRQAKRGIVLSVEGYS